MRKNNFTKTVTLAVARGGGYMLCKDLVARRKANGKCNTPMGWLVTTTMATLLWGLILLCTIAEEFDTEEKETYIPHASGSSAKWDENEDVPDEDD